jgi:hypothetical protein
MIHRRLSLVCLESPVNDPSDRSILPMSTLIASEQWLLEASWDGVAIGDVQIFRNANVGPTGQPIVEGMGPEWEWWGAVPRGRVKSYRFEDGAGIKPLTVKNAEPQAKPVEARARGTA